MKQDDAETFALRVLGWLMTQDDLVDVFQGATGVTLADIKNNAADPVFLGSVLDFVLMDDAWVLKFAGDTGGDAFAVQQARQSLPGGETVHWT